MRKILIILLLLGPLYADLSVQEIEKMVYKIHEKREGLNLGILEATKDPFIKLKKENNVTKIIISEEIEEVKISLHAIVSGRAFINDGWKDINDSVMGYVLKYIGRRGVVLRNGNRIKKLFLHDSKDNFIKIEGR